MTAPSVEVRYDAPYARAFRLRSDQSPRTKATAIVLFATASMMAALVSGLSAAAPALLALAIHEGARAALSLHFARVSFIERQLEVLGLPRSGEKQIHVAIPAGLEVRAGNERRELWSWSSLRFADVGDALEVRTSSGRLLFLYRRGSGDLVAFRRACEEFAGASSSVVGANNTEDSKGHRARTALSKTEWDERLHHLDRVLNHLDLLMLLRGLILIVSGLAASVAVGLGDVTGALAWAIPAMAVALELATARMRRLRAISRRVRTESLFGAEHHWSVDEHGVRHCNGDCDRFVSWSEMSAPSFIPGEAILLYPKLREPLVLFPEDFAASSQQLWEDVEQWWWKHSGTDRS